MMETRVVIIKDFLKDRPWIFKKCLSYLLDTTKPPELKSQLIIEEINSELNLEENNFWAHMFNKTEASATTWIEVEEWVRKLKWFDANY